MYEAVFGKVRADPREGTRGIYTTALFPRQTSSQTSGAPLSFFDAPGRPRSTNLVRTALTASLPAMRSALTRARRATDLPELADTAQRLLQCMEAGG